MARKHCSYCGMRGHTRPTCPEIRKEIRANPNGYQAQTAERKARYKAQRGPSTRQCSYCKKTGHNKTTCTTLKFDRVEYRVKNKKFAKAFIEGCKEFGLYPGALLEICLPEEIYGDRNTEYRQSQLERQRSAFGNLAMVVGFFERNLNSNLSNSDKYLGRNQACLRVRFPNGKQTVLNLPREFQHIAHNSDECKNGFWKMGCPVDASKVESIFSAEWKSGDMSINRQLGLEN
jgi:hypothetical protein